MVESVFWKTIRHALHSELQYHADLQREHADKAPLCSGTGMDMHVSQRFPLHAGSSEVQSGLTAAIIVPARMSSVAMTFCRAAGRLSAVNFHFLFLSDCNMRYSGGSW